MNNTTATAPQPTPQKKKETRFKLTSHGNDLKKRWYVHYTAIDSDGKSYTAKQYKGINNFKTVEGRELAAKHLIEKLEQEIGNVTRKTIRQTLEHALSKESHILRTDTVYAYYSKINVFCQWCDENNVTTFQQINSDVVGEFLKNLIDKGRSNATYNAYKNTLSLLLDKTNKAENPFTEFKNMKKNSTPAKYFNKRDIRKLQYLISNEDPQLWLFCQMMYYCLIRPNELRHVKISDIDLDEGYITILSEHSKVGKTDTVAIPTELQEILDDLELEQYPNDFYLFSKCGSPSYRKVSESHFATTHQAILKSEGYDTDRYKLYSWKHTGAVGMVKNGVSLKDIQIQGRWSTLEMVDSYLRQLGVKDLEKLKSTHTM
jgi:integrase